MKHLQYLPLISILSMLVSCDPRYDPKLTPNFRTKISGQLFDSTNGRTYPNIHLKFTEYTVLMSGGLYNSWEYIYPHVLDSTVTDSLGHFSSAFNTSNTGSDIYVSVISPQNIFIRPNTMYPAPVNGPTYLTRIVDKQNFNNAKSINLNMTKEYCIAVRLHILDAPGYPLSAVLFPAQGFEDRQNFLEVPVFTPGPTSDTTLFFMTSFAGGPNGAYGNGFYDYDLAFQCYLDTAHTYLSDIPIILSVSKDTTYIGPYTTDVSTYRFENPINIGQTKQQAISK